MRALGITGLGKDHQSIQRLFLGPPSSFASKSAAAPSYQAQRAVSR